MDLTTATPVEIDTELKALYEASLEIGQNLNRHAESMHYTADDKSHYVYVGRSSRREWAMSLTEVIEVLRSRVADEEEKVWTIRDAEKALERWNALTEQRKANISEQQVLNAEYVRRGGWTRAFLAVGQGMLHVHSSMNCSSCNKGIEPTRFDWRTEFSGGTEEAVVEASGERACTVCYPSAPVDVLRRPTSIWSPEEIAAKAAREERAQKKAAADALKVIVEDFPTRLARGGVEARRKEFKTLRAATQAAVDARYDMLWRSKHAHLVDEALAAVVMAESIENAIAAFTGRPVEEIRKETFAKAEKKVAKNW